MADQTPGPPPASVAFLLIAVGRHARDRVEAALKREGIALRHMSALGHLSGDEAISYSELARRASVTPQSMQATLRRLEELGAVLKTTDSGRGRTAQLFVTAEGQRLLDVGRAAIAEVDDIIADHLDPDVAEQMVPAFLTVLRALAGDGGNSA